VNTGVINIFSEEYEVLISSLCMIFWHPVIYFVLLPNIFLTTLTLCN
jgi:hypothetical protein